MTTPDIQVPNFFANPVDDLLIGLVILTIRLFWKTDRASAKLVLYLLPLLIKYVRRYYWSGHAHQKLHQVEEDIHAVKKTLHLRNVRKIG